MLIKCEYCGSMIDDSLEECPNCAGVNNNVSRAAKKIPTTIDELKAFCAAKNIDTARMHFHIGEDYKEPKAFGIFKDADGNFVVYKNKADGTRAIRYRGTDEKYAVNELYQKMKTEFLEAREWGNARRSQSGAPTRNGTSGKKKGKFPVWIVIVIAVFVIYVLFNNHRSTFYSYGGDTYCHSSNGWFMYNAVTSTWDTADTTYFDDEFSDHLSEYKVDKDDLSSEYTDSWDDYVRSNNWDDDWDDDDWGSSSDWDDDDYDYWDSDSGSDWDSDW